MPVSNDPLTQFTIEMSKKLSRFITKDLVDQLDDEEDLYSAGQDVESAVKLHSLYFTKSFPLDTLYYSSSEPDGDRDKFWIRGNNLGVTANDISGFDNDAYIFGEPILVSGNPFDLGIHTGKMKSIALRLNRPASPFVNEEYLSIPDVAAIRVPPTSSFSIFIRFRPKSLADQGSQAATLFEKIDDSTPNNAMMLQMSDTGRLRWIVKESGVSYAQETATSTIAVDTVYEVWVTYNGTGNAQKIFVNGVDKTLSSYGGVINWQSTLTNHDLFIGNRGAGSNGFCYMDFYDMLYKRDHIITQAEVDHHYTNKWTTADIPFGQVAVSNYSATFAGTTPSYTSSSFSSSSFTV